MSPCRPLNNHALMPLPLITIGVFIATAILILAVFTMINDHPMKVNTTLKTIATTFHQQVQSVDAACFECSFTWNMPSSIESLSMYLTDQSIILMARKENREYRYIKNSISPWWASDSQSSWTNASTFHHFLKTTYGHDGTIHDPIPIINDTQHQIDTLYQNSQLNISENPVKFESHKPIIIEKLIIYYKDSSGYPQDTRKSYILIHQ